MGGTGKGTACTCGCLPAPKCLPLSPVARTPTPLRRPSPPSPLTSRQEAGLPAAHAVLCEAPLRPPRRQGPPHVGQAAARRGHLCGQRHRVFQRRRRRRSRWAQAEGLGWRGQRVCGGGTWGGGRGGGGAWLGWEQGPGQAPHISRSGRLTCGHSPYSRLPALVHHHCRLPASPHLPAGSAGGSPRQAAVALPPECIAALMAMAAEQLQVRELPLAAGRG